MFFQNSFCLFGNSFTGIYYFNMFWKYLQKQRHQIGIMSTAQNQMVNMLSYHGLNIKLEYAFHFVTVQFSGLDKLYNFIAFLFYNLYPVTVQMRSFMKQITTQGAFSCQNTNGFSLGL